MIFKRKFSFLLAVTMLTANVNVYADVGENQISTANDEVASGGFVDVSVNSLKSGELSCPVDGGNIYIDANTGIVTGSDSCVKDVKIPKSFNGIDIVGISDLAFYNSAVTSLEIPDGVKYIGDKALMNCSELTLVNISTSVDSIGESVFVGCAKLESICVDKDNNTYCSDMGVLYNKEMTVLICFPAGNAGEWSSHSYGSSSNGSRVFVVPKTVEHIADMAFYGCKKLNKISSFYAEYIGSSAFAECDALKEVVIKNVDTISEKAFYNCDYLESVRLYPGVKYIEDCAFSNCWNLIDVDIPYTVTKIGAYSFSGCNSMEKLTLPNHLEYIGNSAFDGCVNFIGDEYLDSYFTIPYTVIYIGNWAFKDCVSLKYAEVPYSVKNITSDRFPAFEGCDNLDIVYCYKGTAADNNSIYPATTQIEYIDDGLEYLQIPYSVSEGTYYYNPVNGEIVDFEEADPFSSDKFDLVVPDTMNGTKITGIADWTFSNIWSVQKIILPNTIVSIGDEVFKNCESLTEITIPKSVENIGTDVFLNCTMLKTINVYKGSYADNSSLYDSSMEIIYIGEAEIIKGDINGDKKVTAVDAMLIAQLASGKRNDDEMYSKADINGDGKVSAVDAMLVARFASGKIDKL